MENSDEDNSDEDGENSESSKGDTDDLGATKVAKDGKKGKKKSTKAKRQEALDKKANEANKSGSTSKNDPTVVADFSREDSASDNPDGSRREMLANADTVRVDKAKGPVGSNRFDVNADGAEELPEGNEEGGGFF